MPAIVVNTIGTGGDYTTLQAWEDACPANLVTADQIWRGEVLNQELAQTLTIAGQTTDATRYVQLTAQAGASFADHADKETNPLRYNASVGAAISASAPYGTVVTITTPHTRVSRLQFADGTVGPTRTIDITGTSSLLDQCIIRTSATCGLAGPSGTVRNVFLHSNGQTVFAVGTNTFVLNCTFVRPSNLGNTTWGIINNYTSITIRNTAIFGVSNFASVSFTGNNNASNATIGWGTDNQASLAYADQFEEPSSASGTQDYRLKAGATLIDNGADLSANGVTTDIVGTARGATYDIGAWEVGSSSTSVTLTGVGVTSSAGSVAGALSLSAAGSSATSASGSISGAIGHTATGAAATASPGSVVGGIAAGATGSGATATPGSVAGVLGASLAGTAASAGAGTPTSAIGMAVTGASAMVMSAGSVAYTIGFLLTGVASTAAGGTLETDGADTSASRSLTGIRMTALPGNIRVTGGVRWTPQAPQAVVPPSMVGNTLPPPPRLVGDPQADNRAIQQWLQTVYDQVVKVNNTLGRLADHETRIARLEADDDDT